MIKKKILPLVSLLTLVLFLGCSNDSENTEEPELPKAVDKTANLLGTGESATDLLTNEDFDKILVEIAHVEGFRPTSEAMDDFGAYLRERTFKVDIDLVYTELPSPDEERLTLPEIADLEEQNRTVYNDGKTLAVYIYFSDAPAEDDDEEEGLVTLGAVYRNTSMIIHEATVRRLADRSVFISDADVESSTLNHEFGHLFGLVNLGTNPVNDHEGVQTDEEGETLVDDNGNPLGNNHCTVDGCLMNAELQFGGPSAKTISQMSKDYDGLKAGCRLSGKSVLHMLAQSTSKGAAMAPDLDSECLLDLRTNGGR